MELQIIDHRNPDQSKNHLGGDIDGVWINFDLLSQDFGDSVKNWMPIVGEIGDAMMRNDRKFINDCKYASLSKPLKNG